MLGVGGLSVGKKAAVNDSAAVARLALICSPSSSLSSSYWSHSFLSFSFFLLFNCFYFFDVVLIVVIAVIFAVALTVVVKA